MATFVEIQTDAFADNISTVQDQLDYTGVRRPYRGLEIKKDTYSLMKVVKSNGQEIALTDAGGPIKAQSGQQTGAGSGVSSPAQRTTKTSTYNYSNFIIQSIVESRQEKSQILETFGDTFIFFFGERPRVLQVSGLLMNTLDFNWRTEFWYNYENVLRGTKLVEQNARIYLHWDDIIVEGYMLSANAQDQAQMPYHIPFQFQLFVTNTIYTSSIGDSAYPITSAVNLEPLTRSGDQVSNAIRELKAQGIAGEEYTSNVNEVRLALEQSEQARLAFRDGEFTPLGSSSGLTVSVLGAQFDTGINAQKFNAGKNLLTNALAIGVQAQNLTFLSIVNHFFKNRVMRFPKGIGGADSYAGPPQFASQPHPYQDQVVRTKALRSEIRDNVDEYIGAQFAKDDRDLINSALAAQQWDNKHEFEIKALQDLKDMGIDPIQHPGGKNPFSKANALSAFGVSTDLSAFGV
jgi:hypothetical protein